MIIDLPLLVGPISSKFGIRCLFGHAYSVSSRSSASVARGIADPPVGPHVLDALVRRQPGDPCAAGNRWDRSMMALRPQLTTARSPSNGLAGAGVSPRASMFASGGAGLRQAEPTP